MNNFPAMSHSCLESSRPVSEHGATCHQTWLTTDALLALRFCQRRGKLRSVPKAPNGKRNPYTRHLQDALVSEGLMFRVNGGWLRLTTKGHELINAKRCSHISSLSHEARGECYGRAYTDKSTERHMCDGRPYTFRFAAGAYVIGRFTKTCS